MMRINTHTHPVRALAAGLFLALALLGAGQPALAQKDAQKAEALTPEEKEAERNARLKLMETALEKLYKLNPEARQEVEQAAGYAVFDINAIYAILFVGQKGKGVMIDNATKQPTFMLSLRAGTGPGVGKQRLYQVFVFKSKEAMGQFKLAGGLGGDVSATATAGKDGLLRSFNPSISVYQIPESGYAVQASWGGTVYSLDSQLQ